MISSDSPETGAELAQELKIDETYHARNEAEKAEVIAAVRKSMEESGGYLAYVNNGYEDMGALTSADLGIALNGLISDEAMKSSNILLIKNEASRLSAAIKLAMNVQSTIKTNIIIMGIVISIMAFATVFGVARLWLIALALGIASVITALNATRYDTSTAARK
jgi:Cd2+/Zn2+-exporting ATPase